MHEHSTPCCRRAYPGTAHRMSSARGNPTQRPRCLAVRDGQCVRTSSSSLRTISGTQTWAPTAETQIRTPNIDRLAAEGMKFTDAYAAPVCAPSRCSFASRDFPPGHCFIRGNAKVNLRPQDTTITEVLHNAGYNVFSIGKWSMGAVNSTGDPTHKGVDYFFGYIDQTHAQLLSFLSLSQ